MKVTKKEIIINDEPCPLCPRADKHTHPRYNSEGWDMSHPLNQINTTWLAFSRYKPDEQEPK